MTGLGESRSSTPQPKKFLVFLSGFVQRGDWGQHGDEMAPFAQVCPVRGRSVIGDDALCEESSMFLCMIQCHGEKAMGCR
jgi:hypothetical protein